MNDRIRENRPIKRNSHPDSKILIQRNIEVLRSNFNIVEIIKIVNTEVDVSTINQENELTNDFIYNDIIEDPLYDEVNASNAWIVDRDPFKDTFEGKKKVEEQDEEEPNVEKPSKGKEGEKATRNAYHKRYESSEEEYSLKKRSNESSEEEYSSEKRSNESSEEDSIQFEKTEFVVLL